MTPAEALQLAAEAYPQGPEAIAVRLGAEVRYEPLSKDGWCLRGPAKIVIKLNSNAPATHQRFTLAHEVAHLIFGTKTDIADRGFEGYDSKSPAERQADALASQLLLPVGHVQPHITTPVVDPTMIRKIGKQATVSEQVVALRLARLAGELGIGAGLGAL